MSALDLGSLRFRPLDDSSPDWLRATLIVDGTEHFVDLVAVQVDRHGIQLGKTKDLDAMIRLHHLACGADGPFVTVEHADQPYVLFVTPSAA